MCGKTRLFSRRIQLAPYNIFFLHANFGEVGRHLRFIVAPWGPAATTHNGPHSGPSPALRSPHQRRSREQRTLRGFRLRSCWDPLFPACEFTCWLVHVLLAQEVAHPLALRPRIRSDQFATGPVGVPLHVCGLRSAGEGEPNRSTD